jgi:hypothetical protein
LFVVYLTVLLVTTSTTTTTTTTTTITIIIVVILHELGLDRRVSPSSDVLLKGLHKRRPFGLSFSNYRNWVRTNER